jgi:hypothetical protein
MPQSLYKVIELIGAADKLNRTAFEGDRPIFGSTFCATGFKIDQPRQGPSGWRSASVRPNSRCRCGGRSWAWLAYRERQVGAPSMSARKT